MHLWAFQRVPTRPFCQPVHKIPFSRHLVPTLPGDLIMPKTLLTHLYHDPRTTDNMIDMFCEYESVLEFILSLFTPSTPLGVSVSPFFYSNLSFEEHYCDRIIQ